MFQPLNINDFSGGMTDYYMDAPQNKCKMSDNLLLVRHAQNMAKLFTRPGSEIWDTVNYQIPAGNQRIGTLKLFQDKLLVQSARKFYYVNAGAWVTLQGPTSNDVFSASTTTTSVVNIGNWNNHLYLCTDGYEKPQKIFPNNSLVLQARTAGLPFLATDPVVTPGANTGQSFIYAFIYQITYTAKNLTYIDRGPITEVLVTNADAPNLNANAISAIPVLANGATDNYDTANIKVEIYRTTNGGEDFFFVGLVTNGTTVFNDTLSDALLVDNESLYTTGDVVENTPPPLCKTLAITQSYAYYANIKEGSEIFPNRIRQSKQDDMDSAPEDFITDLDDEIMQMTSFREIPIALGKTFIYRIEGVYDENARGGMFPVRISDIAGCVSGQSAVQTELGVFWFGKDGVYFTDGYQCTKVNKNLDQTYANYISLSNKALAQTRIQGRYDSKNRRIWWSVWQTDSSLDVDTCFVLDLNYGISDDMPFTTVSGGAAFAPTSLEFDEENMYRADKRGYILRHLSSLFSDPKVDINVVATAWGLQTITYDYVSVAYNMGVDYIRKYATRLSINAANETNLSLQAISINDDGRVSGDLKPIRSRNNITWGDPDVYFGDPNLVWNRGGLVDSERKFPSGSMRFTYKQIAMTNAFVAIINSDLIGNASASFLTSATKNVTLVGSPQYAWPDKCVDYYISFENDGYIFDYKILSRTDATIIIATDVGTLPDGTYAWVIRGYPKDETLNLISYTIQSVAFSETQQAFFKSQTGEVGASGS